MTRSRAFNRAKRFNARKRRRDLRSFHSSVRDGFCAVKESFDDSRKLFLKAVIQENLLAFEDSDWN